MCMYVHTDGQVTQTNERDSTPSPRWTHPPQQCTYTSPKKYTPYPLVSMATDCRSCGYRRQQAAGEVTGVRGVPVCHLSLPRETTHNTVLLYSLLSLSSLTFIAQIHNKTHIYLCLHTHTHTHVHGHTCTIQTGLRHLTCVVFLLEHDHGQPPRHTTLHLFLFPAAAGEGQPVLGSSKGLRQRTHHVTLIPPCLLLPHFSQSGWGMRLCMYVSVYGRMCIVLAFRADRHVFFKPTLHK